jgi:hypothetical protein
MSNHKRNLIISSNEYRDLKNEEPFKLKDSNFKIYTSIGDPDFDNDDNEYGSIQMHYYSNRVTKNTSYPTDNVKMVPC